MSGQRYSLDTRRSEFSAAADLGGAEDLVDLVQFEAPESLGAGLPVGLVSQAGHLAAGIDIGWRRADRLCAEASVKAGETLWLSARSQSLRRALFDQQGRGGGDARLIAIPFLTTIAFARGVQASGPRRLEVSPLIDAPAPGVLTEASRVDLSSSAPGMSFRLGRIVISMPGDIALEDAPSILVELTAEGLDPASLSLAVEPLWAGAASLARDPDARSGIGRWILALTDPASLAGQNPALLIDIDATALMAFVERAGAASDSRADPAQTGADPVLAVSARLTGWNGANRAADMAQGRTRRLWRLNANPLSVPVSGVREGVALIKVAGSTLPWALEPGRLRAEPLPPLRLAYDLDAPRRSFILPPLALSIAGWPLARGRALTARARLVAGPGSGAGGVQTVIEESVPLEVTPGSFRRSGNAALDLEPLRAALLDDLEQTVAMRAEWRGLIEVTLSAAQEPGSPHIEIALPLVARPTPRRATICIDAGVTAISAWTGPPAPQARATGLSLAAVSRGDDAGGTDTDRSAGSASLAGLLPARPADRLGPDALAAALQGSRPPLPALAGFDHGIRFIPPQTGADRLDSIAVMAGARRPAALKAAVLAGPSAAAPPGGDARRPAALLADALAELVTGRLLPALPALRRADEARARLVPRLMITMPEGVCGELQGAYQTVASLLCSRLEPFFPGTRSEPGAALLIGEAVAAGHHAASLLDRSAAPDPSRQLLAIDIGASATCVAVMQPGATRLATLAAFSLPIGGDALHRALLECVLPCVAALRQRLGDGWRWSDGDAAPDLAASDDGAGHALDMLSAALAKAQMALGGKIAAAAADGGQPYAWTEGEGAPTLDIALGSFGGAAPPRGALLPVNAIAAAATPRAGELATGARWQVFDAEGGRRELVLRLGRAALETAGSAQGRLRALTTFLAATLPRMARSAVPAGAERPSRDIVVTGRGALWPPLHEALSEAAAQAGDRLVLAAPLPPERMKLAVSAGAAIIAAENAPSQDVAAILRPRHGAPLAIAVLSVRVATEAGMASATTFVVERLLYLAGSVGAAERSYEAENAAQPSLSGRVNLGRRFAFVRALPGLDPAGRLVKTIRGLSQGWEPVHMLDGDGIADAAQLGLSAFGPCDIASRLQPDGSTRVTISMLDHDWTGAWTLDGDMALLDAGSTPAEGRG